MRFNNALFVKVASFGVAFNLSIASLVSPSFAASDATPQGETVTIDTQNSSLEWLGKKLLGQHSGAIRLKSGSVTISNGVPTGGKFEIDMASIFVKDITDPTDNAKLTGHLKSDDFFGAALFPVTTVELAKFEPIANAVPGKPNYNVSGSVTIKGISQPLAFPALVTIAEGRATANAVISIDRTKFGVRYGSNKFFDNLGNRVIHDNFDVTVNVVGFAAAKGNS